MKRQIGAEYTGEGVIFTVWAPDAEQVKVNIISPLEQSLPLTKDDFGYWTTEVQGLGSGALYQYELDNEKLRPDPASQSQPEGVHGPSEVVNHGAFTWTDQAWKGLPLRDMIIYELHTGTFTAEGTFDGVVAKIPYLLDLGINAIELMPIAQFPGGRNWGYDGVFPFAAQDSYGGAEGLKRLVDACHRVGIAVVLDVVYNHMGPEGNYLNDYGPYFTDKYSTPWGKALNFDDAYADAVRNFFLQNALMWLRDFHIDALRLDAVHAIKDFSARHFLLQLSEEVKALGRELDRELVLIAECDLNDPKFLNPKEKGGFGMDGQWIDEFHHSLHALVTGELDGYYSDFGTLEHLRKAFQDSFVYTGQYSEHRKKTFGLSPDNNPYSQFIVFAQNHDHIGNRMLGDRLSQTLNFEQLKLVAATYLLSPYVPLVFMGEEYGEDRPFTYFISHTDEELVEAVRKGRKREFEYFHRGEGQVPDPQSEETFASCKLNWNFSEDRTKKTLFDFYKLLIRFRKSNPAFRIDRRGTLEVKADESRQLISIERFEDLGKQKPLFFAVLNYGEQDTEWTKSNRQATHWQKVLDTADVTWNGPGSQAPDTLRNGDALFIRKHSVLLYAYQPEREEEA
jgi:maltooligosyltrehalose trehalohydrolase